MQVRVMYHTTYTRKQKQKAKERLHLQRNKNKTKEKGKQWHLHTERQIILNYKKMVIIQNMNIKPSLALQDTTDMSLF